MYLFTPTAMINVDDYAKIYLDGDSIQGVLPNGKVTVLYLGSHEDCLSRFKALCEAKQSCSLRCVESIDGFDLYSVRR